MEKEEVDITIEKELENELIFQALEDELNNVETKTPNDNKKVKKSKKGKGVFGRLKIKTVVLLLLTLIANTYAWFIYISTVSANLSMHIKSWDVVFSDGEAEEDFVFTVERIYPGMDDAEQTITASNNGETNAKMQLVVQSIKILDEDFYVVPAISDANPTATVKNGNEMLDILSDDYPFKIQIIINNQEYDGSDVSVAAGSSINILFKVTWDYETGADVNTIASNDEIDTLWGNKAYTYMQNAQDDDYCIEVKVKMQAIQDNT